MHIHEATRTPALRRAARWVAAAGLWIPLAAPAPATAAAPRPADVSRLAEAFRLAEALGEAFWPGWTEGRFTVLLVGAEEEHLFHAPDQPQGFERLEGEGWPGGAVWRAPARRPPGLLATFPLFPGRPVVVLGTAEATGLDPAAWVATLLHERFHQLQMSDPGYFPAVAELDLAAGDETGTWMLDYPFPYDGAEVGAALGDASLRLLEALDAPEAEYGAALERALESIAGLESSIAPADRRYLAFQLWQEGVARFVELDAMRRASELAPGAGGSLSGARPYAEVAAEIEASIRRGLAEPALAERRRVAFYDLGAGLALALDRLDPGWRGRYWTRRFALADELARAAAGREGAP